MHTKLRMHQQSRLIDVHCPRFHPFLNPVPVFALVSTLVNAKWSSLSAFSVSVTLMTIKKKKKRDAKGTHLTPHCIGKTVKSALHLTASRTYCRQCSGKNNQLGPSILIQATRLTAVLLKGNLLLFSSARVVVIEVKKVMNTLNTMN